MATDDPGSDENRPNVARAYDYTLGGAHNFAVDRELVEAMLVDWPDLVNSTRANRTFLRLAVHHALDRGLRQFLDVGSGIPTVGNVHEVALARDPDARVAYVDNEAIAVAQSEMLLADVDHATITRGDVRDPDAIFAAPGVGGLLDLDEPVALLMLSVLHFVDDYADPRGLLEAYRRRLAPGSILVVSHASDTYHPAAAARVDSTPTPVNRRDVDALAAVLAPFGIGPADLADVSQRVPEAPDRPLGLLTAISEEI